MRSGFNNTLEDLDFADEIGLISPIFKQKDKTDHKQMQSEWDSISISTNANLWERTVVLIDNNWTGRLEDVEKCVYLRLTVAKDRGGSKVINDRLNKALEPSTTW